MEMVERRLDRTQKALKGDKTLQGEVDFLKRILATLEQGKAARTVECSDDEKAFLQTLTLLTAKPIIYAANLSETDFADGNADQNTEYQKVVKVAAEEGAEVLPICAQMEADIADMEAEEKTMFLEELGLSHSGLDRLIQKSYSLLGLISYLTAGPTEVRAWTIVNGTKAPGAAGKIHTDFERGFIRAEVVAFTDLVACGSMTAAKEKGLVRSEGKEYVMKDGDVVLFRFNV
jgi:GTP-binding protein YchF